MAGCHALGTPVVEDPNRTTGSRAREIRGHHALRRRALLRAEAAAHELARDVHAVGIEPERPRELGACVPDALGGDEGVQLVAEPLRDAAMRLEGVMHLRR